MEKWVLINGVSDGPGKELAIEFARSGFCLFLIGENSSTLKKKLAGFSHSNGIKIKVRTKNSTDSDLITEVGKQLFDVVVNNTDLGLKGGQFDQNSEVEIKEMSEKFFAVCKLTKSLLPQMIEAKTGKILNIVPSPNGEIQSLYRSALLSFSSVLQDELSKHGISVTTVSPTILKGRFCQNFSDIFEAEINAKQICEMAKKKKIPAEYFSQQF